MFLGFVTLSVNSEFLSDRNHILGFVFLMLTEYLELDRVLIDFH